MVLEEEAILHAKVHCQDHVGISSAANRANSGTHVTSQNQVSLPIADRNYCPRGIRSLDRVVSGRRSCRNCLGAVSNPVSRVVARRRNPSSHQLKANSRGVQKEKDNEP